VERILQRSFLDQHYVLRADVKVQEVKARRVVRSTPMSTPGLELQRPITVATAKGVFYLSDYARKERLETDVHVGLGSPDQSPSGDPRGGFPQAADVVEISGEPQIILRGGELVRVTGVEESPEGARVTLEGFGAGPVQAILRSEKPRHLAPAERAAGFSASLAQLLFLVPDEPEGRKQWMQPDWPERIRAAIGEGRVVVGMTDVQVLLAWGTPLYITGEGTEAEGVWTFQRGSTVREQLRNKTRVYFSRGQVVQVEED
jgi:hypothetical protein